MSRAPFKRTSQKSRVDRQKLAEMWPHKTLDEIASLFKVTRFTISRTASEMGLRPKTSKLKLDVQRLRHMLAGGLSIEVISDRMGCSESTVYRAIKREGLAQGQVTETPRPPEPPKPAPSHNTLTGRLIATKGRWSELEAIRKAQGWTPAQVQQRYHAARHAG